MKAVFREERVARRGLVRFLKEHFDGLRLLDEARLRKFKRYGKFVEPKT